MNKIVLDRNIPKENTFNLFVVTLGYAMVIGSTLGFVVAHYDEMDWLTSALYILILCISVAGVLNLVEFLHKLRTWHHFTSAPKDTIVLINHRHVGVPVAGYLTTDDKNLVVLVLFRVPTNLDSTNHVSSYIESLDEAIYWRPLSPWRQP